MTALSSSAPSLFGTGWVARRVDGEAMRTVDGVLDSLAAAWRFPDHFGRNRDALDDCMRDLPTDLPTAEGGPSTGLLTIVVHAGALLADAPDELEWFAESVDFWHDHYHDRRFAVLLTDDDPAAVRDRWAAVGTQLTDPTEEI
ncbi:barstar family protein [Gordonia humi]|uniref:Barstar (barnase inhibitor) domain-containing protein n=1 Tax=Gordonia humi TaxID=686429 RepID=A0A840EY08_9ACTN|nr:barstar family protein [Gordonia humi]MBB4137935.1 hypothetical protein [Gordonia humi]